MRKAVLYILTSFAAMWILGACASKEPAQDIQSPESVAKTIKVRIANIVVNNEALPINSSGMISSKSETKLSFKIGGIIEDILVEEGQQVRKGQVLARLALAEINAQVAQAASAVEKASRDLKRVQNLYQDSVATLEQLQNTKTGLEVAKSNLEVATFNQQYATIRAPSSGRVLRRFAEIREMTGPGAPILQLAANSNAQVMRIGVADRDIVKLRIGDEASIQFDAYPQEIFKAKVSELAIIADPRTGTFEVELQLLPSQKPLKSGFVGKVAIYPSEAIAHYRLPMGALVEAADDKAYIYLPSTDGKKAQRRTVHPLHIGHNFFTVPIQDLEGVSQVITDGNMYLEDQMDIDIQL